MAHKQNIKHSCITKKIYEYIGYGTTKDKIISAYTPDQLQLWRLQAVNSIYTAQEVI
jgi:hypothetical protein